MAKLSVHCRELEATASMVEANCAVWHALAALFGSDVNPFLSGESQDPQLLKLSVELEKQSFRALARSRDASKNAEWTAVAACATRAAASFLLLSPAGHPHHCANPALLMLCCLKSLASTVGTFSTSDC